MQHYIPSCPWGSPASLTQLRRSHGLPGPYDPLLLDMCFCNRHLFRKFEEIEELISQAYEKQLEYLLINRIQVSISGCSLRVRDKGIDRGAFGTAGPDCPISKPHSVHLSLPPWVLQNCSPLFSVYRVRSLWEHSTDAEDHKDCRNTACA